MISRKLNTKTKYISVLETHWNNLLGEKESILKNLSLKVLEINIVENELEKQKSTNRYISEQNSRLVLLQKRKNEELCQQGQGINQHEENN